MKVTTLRNVVNTAANRMANYRSLRERKVLTKMPVKSKRKHPPCTCWVQRRV